MSRASLVTLAFASLTFACDRGPTSTTGIVPLDARAAATSGPSVNGAGTVSVPGGSTEHITVNVEGQSGRATFQDKAAGGNFNGQIDVNCVVYAGNTATISGIVTHSNDRSLIGREAVFQIVDNGNGAVPDFASLINFHDVGTGSDCTVPEEFDLLPVKGNFTVQD